MFEYKGTHYLLMVDYYSKYPEVYCLNKGTKACDVINAHKSIFSRHGICEELVSDNGPQYASYEFKQFSKEWEFKHTTSSPRYSRSNGQAERMVQTVKNLIKKAKDPCYALLVYRATPIEGIGYSPSQLLMGRMLNTKIPTSKEQLAPRLPDHEMVKGRLNQNQLIQKKYYDQGTKEQPPLQVGEGVRVKLQTWQPAVVTQRLEPRSYVVKTEKGSVLRRNSEVIKSSREVNPQEILNKRHTSGDLDPEELVIPQRTGQIKSNQNGQQDVIPKARNNPPATPTGGNNSCVIPEAGNNVSVRRSERRVIQPKWQEDYEMN
jgi:hypothetical protein